jgi:hypothetical protein
MDEDVDFSGWELPPLEDDPDREPPPERPPYSGVSIGSDLAGLRHAGSDTLDLGEFVCNDLVSLRPTAVDLADLVIARDGTCTFPRSGLRCGWPTRRQRASTAPT